MEPGYKGPDSPDPLIFAVPAIARLSLSTFFLFSNQLQPQPSARLRLRKISGLAINHRTPYDVFSRADKIWRETRGSKLFEGSYLSQYPSIWANQRLGLATCTCTHLANHINTSLTKISHGRGENTSALSFTVLLPV